MSTLTKLGLYSASVFVVGTIAALLLLGDGVGTIVDTFSYLDNRSVMHYYFVVRVSKYKVKTVRVTEKVYNSHGYGDIFDSSWCKNDGYFETDLEPVGKDQNAEPH